MTTAIESYLSALGCVIEIIEYEIAIGRTASHTLGVVMPNDMEKGWNWEISFAIGTDTFYQTHTVACVDGMISLPGLVPILAKKQSPLRLNSLICASILGVQEIPAPSRRAIRQAEQAAALIVAQELKAALATGNIDDRFFAREDEAEVWDEIVTMADIPHPYGRMRTNSIPSYLLSAFDDVYYEAASEAIGAKCAAARRRLGVQA